MPWFKVDDGFHSHRKTLMSRPAALGLWVVAGSWSSANLTEGFIPDRVLGRLMPGAKKLARELVEVGLWERVDEPDKGFTFHDWGHYNPTADEVRSERERARERMRNLRAARRRQAGLAGEIEAGTTTATPDRHEYVRANTTRTFARSSKEVRNPVPSRPIPTHDYISSQSVTPPYPAHDDQTDDGQDFSAVDEMVKRELAPLAAQPITDQQAAHIRQAILARARSRVKNPARYVQRALRANPHEHLPTPPPTAHRRNRPTCPIHTYMDQPCRACAADRKAIN
ncbi:hypothetical protein ACFMQL_20370 [Nonomuraea fastidiosa]|uniref:hypothetical protein n=1 Tax=Nonomuraea fastidiosa TaxID=46173 RepID=UPI00366ECEBC